MIWQLVDFVLPALEEAGDTDRVRSGIEAILRAGNGAAVQRTAVAESETHAGRRVSNHRPSIGTRAATSGSRQYLDRAGRTVDAQKVPVADLTRHVHCPHHTRQPELSGDDRTVAGRATDIHHDGTGQDKEA